MDLRLSNPHVKRDVLVQQANASFRYRSITFIHAYSRFILDMFDDLATRARLRKDLGQQEASEYIIEKLRERVMQIAHHV